MRFSINLAKIDSFVLTGLGHRIAVVMRHGFLFCLSIK